jgi:hypothetical protein
MNRALRATDPLLPYVIRRRVRHSGGGHAAFRLGFFAVVLFFLVPPALLELMGLGYKAGGNPLVKFHPATYFVVLGALAAILRGGRPGDRITELLSDSPALVAFIILIIDCVIYLLCNVGISGSAVFIETFLTAGLLTLALETGTERERRFLGYTILTFVLLNTVMVVGETLTHTELIPAMPQSVDGVAPVPLSGPLASTDFRGSALYGHPLLGSLVTAMAIFLLIGMRLRPFWTALFFTTLMIGIMAFSGRAATLVIAVFLMLSGVFVLVRGLITRNLSGGFVAGLFGFLFILLPLMVVIGTETSIGQRMIDHLYLDDSARVREVEWRVFDYLDLHQALFGMTLEQVNNLKAQLGLFTAHTDIENPWLLLFLNLGAIGFIVLIAALLFLIYHLLRKAPASGWLLLISMFLIESTSNSLGEKTDDLCFLAACMVAIKAFTPSPVPVVPVERRISPSSTRNSGIGLGPTPNGEHRNLTLVPLGQRRSLHPSRR